MEPPLKTRKSKLSASLAPASKPDSSHAPFPAVPLLMEHRESHLQCSRSGSKPVGFSRSGRSPSHPSRLRHTRKTVRVSSYQDDAIRNTVEDWADDVPALE